jgi:hypothetical protein
MALATTDMALITTDPRTSASRSRAGRVGDGVIAGYVRSLTRTTRTPYNLADGPERTNQAGVAELVDAPVLGAGGRKLLGVRVPPPASKRKSRSRSRGGWLASPELAC